MSVVPVPALASASAAAAAAAKKRKIVGGHDSVSRMNDCFLCRWGKKEYSVNDYHMQTLIRILDDNIGDISPPFIALVMHAYYNKTLRPEAMRCGQFLPPWRSKRILMCITTHNYRPQMRLLASIDMLTMLVMALERQAYRVEADGTPHVDINTVKQIVNVTKTIWHLYAVKLPNMNWNNASQGNQQQFNGGAPRYRSVGLRDNSKRRRVSVLGGTKGRQKDRPVE